MSDFKNFIVNFEQPTAAFLNNPVVDFITQPAFMGPFYDHDAASSWTPAACNPRIVYGTYPGECYFDVYITGAQHFTWEWPTNIPENQTGVLTIYNQKHAEAFNQSCASYTPPAGSEYCKGSCDLDYTPVSARFTSYSVEIYDPSTDSFSSLGGSNWSYYSGSFPESVYTVPRNIIVPYEEYMVSSVGACDEDPTVVTAPVPPSLTYKLKTVAAGVNVSQKLTAGVGVYRAIKKFYEEWAEVPGLPAGILTNINQQITLATKIIAIFETGVLPEDPQAPEYVNFRNYMCFPCLTESTDAYTPKRPEIILKVISTVPAPAPGTWSEIFPSSIGIKLAGRVIAYSPVGAYTDSFTSNSSKPVEESIYTDSNFPVAVRILARTVYL